MSLVRVTSIPEALKTSRLELGPSAVAVASTALDTVSGGDGEDLVQGGDGDDAPYGFGPAKTEWGSGLITGRLIVFGYPNTPVAAATTSSCSPGRTASKALSLSAAKTPSTCTSWPRPASPGPSPRRAPTR